MFCPKCGTENPETGKFCRSCGTDISGISKALNKKSSSSDDLWGGDEVWGGNWTGNSCDPLTGEKIDKSDPDDIFNSGVKSVITGFGFAVISLVLLFTGVAGGKTWWWAMLFPAFFSFANGVSGILKANSLRRKQSQGYPMMQNQIPNSQANQSLPPTQTEYVKPTQSIYETGEFVVPPSVTEHTTRQIEINKEGETMTLPKK